MKKLVISIAFFAIQNAGAAFADSYDVYSVENEGVHWIYSNSPENRYGITPVTSINEAKCNEISTELAEAGMMELCRKDPDDIACLRDDMKMVAEAMSFGAVYSRTKQPEDIDSAAIANWKLVGQGSHAADPQLLNEYAMQLGIDPKKSAVAQIELKDMKLAGEFGDPTFLFRRPVSTEHQGYSYSWLFQDKFEMVPEENKWLYFQHFKGSPEVTISSYVLNCELNRGASDYIDVVVDTTATGIRYHSPEVVDAAFKAYQELAAKEIPAVMTNEERSLMYGYYLARSFPTELVESIGLTNLAAMLFDQPEGKVTLKKLATKEQLNDAISIVGTHVNRNQTIRLSKTP